MSNDLLYQIALTLVPGIGPIQAKSLIRQFGTAAAIFKAPVKKLEVIDQIGAVRAGAIKSFTGFEAAEQEMAFMEKYKIRPLFFTDDAYPKRLQHCYDAPVMLYYRGTADLNATHVISIIGTRNNTDYGRQFCEKLIADLSGRPVLVVSGLAFGVDAIAHKAALQNGLPTVGVLAHGLDTMYPTQHKSLARDMLANGGLLTEFMQETKPDKHNFPRRNRIVAGIADATIVVETAVKGGSMITAELAYNYNRDVFALPGRTTDSKSAGCNYLVRHNRATLLTDAQQLVEALGWEKKKVSPAVQRQMFINLSEQEQLIVDLLRTKEALHIDEIYLASGLSSSAVAAALLNLELQGFVLSLPGKMIRLADQ